mgnify:CR=1 FL=1
MAKNKMVKSNKVVFESDEKKSILIAVIISIVLVIATVIVFVGAIASAGLVWDLADMLQGLAVVINVPVILILSKTKIQKPQFDNGLNFNPQTGLAIGILIVGLAVSLYTGIPVFSY